MQRRDGRSADPPSNQAHLAQHMLQTLALISRQGANRRARRATFYTDQIKRFLDDDRKVPRKSVTQRRKRFLRAFRADQVPA